MIWRGPMASKALNQMIFDDWGVDFLLIDLPPGTGDIHLSILQALPVTGAVVVSTQAVALTRVRGFHVSTRFDSGSSLGLWRICPILPHKNCQKINITFLERMGPIPGGRCWGTFFRRFTTCTKFSRSWRRRDLL